MRRIRYYNMEPLKESKGWITKSKKASLEIYDEKYKKFIFIEFGKKVKIKAFDAKDDKTIINKIHEWKG